MSRNLLSFSVRMKFFRDMTFQEMICMNPHQMKVSFLALCSSHFPLESLKVKIGGESVSFIRMTGELESDLGDDLEAPELDPPPTAPEPLESPKKKAKTAAESSVPKADKIAVPDVAADELMVEDVCLIEGMNSSLPKGWIVVDNQFQLDEAHVFAEVSEKNMHLQEKLGFIDAKKKELQNYFHNAAWEFADPVDAKSKTSRTITARWVLTWKTVGGQPQRAKARLVLKGFQDPDLLSLEKSSPAAGRLGKMVLLATASVNEW